MFYDVEAQVFVPEDFPANPHTVRAALDSIQAFTHLSAATVSPSWLMSEENQPDPRDIVPCRSSLLHLPTMTTMPPTPAFFSVNAVDYDPDPQAPEPMAWHQFLHELFDGDLESLDLLHTVRDLAGRQGPLGTDSMLHAARRPILTLGRASWGDWKRVGPSVDM